MDDNPRDLPTRENSRRRKGRSSGTRSGVDLVTTNAGGSLSLNELTTQDKTTNLAYKEKISDLVEYISGFSTYLRNGEYSDYTIRLKHSQEKYRVHKVFIAYESKYFQKLFEGNFKDSNDKEIELELIDANCEKVWYSVLKYMYTGSILLDLATAPLVLVVADRLSMEKLLVKAGSFLEWELKEAAANSFQSQVVLDVYKLCIGYNFESMDKPQRRVLHSCRKLIQRNFGTFVSMDFSFLAPAEFKHLIAGQEKLYPEVASRYVEGNQDHLTKAQFEDLVANFDHFDPRNVVAFLKLAEKFDSALVLEKVRNNSEGLAKADLRVRQALTTMAEEFLRIPPESFLAAPTETVLTVLKEDSLSVTNEDDVFTFVVALLQNKNCTWSKKTKRKVWSCVRFAHCSAGVLERAVEVGAPAEEVNVGLLNALRVAQGQESKTPIKKRSGLPKKKSGSTFVDCPYRNAPFGTTSVFYWLGTVAPKSEEYDNPVKQGVLVISCNWGFFDSSNGAALVARKHKGFYTNQGDNVTITFELKKDWEVSPTHYSLCHGDKTNTRALRHWNFEASTDGEEWRLLKAHKDDGSLAAPFAEAAWPIDSGQTFFRAFRIVLTMPNNSGENEIDLCGFDLFGRIRGKQLSASGAAELAVPYEERRRRSDDSGRSASPPPSVK